MIFFLLAQVAATPEGFWPVTAVGWVTAFGFILTVGGIVVGWGKMIEKLNGYGSRLTETEQAQSLADGKTQGIVLNVDRILNQHDLILKALGEAKRTAEKCGEDSDAIALRIENRLDVIKAELATVNLNLAQRLASVETRLPRHP